MLFCLLSLGLWGRAFVAARPGPAVSSAAAASGAEAYSNRP
jgi:hypothetical protein